MFSAIKKRWAEARADVIGKQLKDALERYDAMNPNDRYFVFSAFDTVLSDLEDQLGPLANWTSEQRKATAKQIMDASRQSFNTPGSGVHAETSRLGAHGGAFLSLYLELQTLPGSQAISLVKAIEDWRKSTAADQS